MKKIVTILVCISIAFFSCKNSTPEFMKVKGLRMEIGNKPYYFVGVNMYYACYLGSTEEGKQRLIKEFDLLKSLGVTNIRVLGGSESSGLKTSLSKGIQIEAGKTDSSLLRGLDFALAEMAKRKMYAVVYLNNFWDWSGGMPKYVEWTKDSPAPDPNRTNDWKNYMLYAASFYTNEPAQKLFQNYINQLINRTNTITGIQYKNDPTIMAWELANEPRPGPDGVDDSAHIEILASWVDSTAAFIRSIDANHLVTTGTEGLVGCVNNEKGFLKIHSSKNIDFLTFHLWAKNWSWYDAKDYSGTFPTAIEKATQYINKHIALARQLGKPITMEEFGLERDSGFTDPSSTVKARDEYFSYILKLITDSSSKGSPIVGSNIWAWGGYGIPTPIEKVIDTPSAFLGDPLGEGQGLNSVFATDTSTLEIIKKSNNILEKIGN